MNDHHSTLEAQIEADLAEIEKRIDRLAASQRHADSASSLREDQDRLDRLFGTRARLIRRLGALRRGGRA